MPKTAAALTVFCVTLLMTLKMLCGLPESSELLQFAADDLYARQRYAQYRCFKEGFDEALTSLGAGRISLREAHGRVHSLAVHYHPEYLEHLSRAESGATVEIRMARNLVSHIDSQAESQPALATRMPSLNVELAELLDELAPGEKP